MRTNEAIGIIAYGSGIGGAIDTAIVGKLGYDHGVRQLATGVEIGMTLKDLEVTLNKFKEERENNSEHNE